MAAEAHALDPATLSSDAGGAGAWTYFHTTGSREELAVCLDRLRARGWTISDQPPEAGPFGTWDVVVRPPLR